MDCSQKEESSLSDGIIEVEIKRICADCKTTKTPLWRSGPSGPKTLCNACGIRQRKKRSPFVGLDRPIGRERKKENPTTNSAAAAAATISTKNGGKKGKIGKSKDVMKVNVLYLQRQRSPMKRQRIPRQWGEVERAALILMALSRGAVFA
ncbi:unnamed protein product [Fraxinus pennsylvanica]|uniref:GATA-type domain-containing protein n=1 Tax=Fraxinus pennsylvanica TaxID=56036 RepID=A0AAD1ZFN0_9LAMI|nr:unnamed protein product [Fraxinus pennsylvanica]